MKPWLLYSLFAMLSWGGYIVVAKVATSDQYFGLPPKWAAVLIYVGIGLVFAVYYLFAKDGKSNLNHQSILAGISSGVLWALGMVFSLLALKAGADVSRLVPIYNCNTLVAVLLGIIFLREISNIASISSVIIGSILITVGGVLVVR